MKQARELAETARSQLAAGIDPIKERRRLKREALQSANTFEHLAHETFEARKSELKGDGKNGRWFTPLELHVLPNLGSVPVEELPREIFVIVLAYSGMKKRIQHARLLTEQTSSSGMRPRLA